MRPATSDAFTNSSSPPAGDDSRAGNGTPAHMSAPFRREVEVLFGAHFARVYRVLHRLSGDPDLAADLAQDAFVKLYERGSRPDAPEAWLITVALNRFRNVVAKRARRARLLTVERATRALADPAPSPAGAVIAAESGERVRAALDRLPVRERQMLLLAAEGYRYRDIAAALGLGESSIGTLLARAKRAFRDAYGGTGDAP